jgi:nucleoside phosphorylase
MTYSADKVLAALFRLYGEGKPQQERGEAFLEHALAAALSEPGVWGRVAEHAGFNAPREDPRVTTQDRVDDGRTDVSLHWPGQVDVVLELKQRDPPSPEQVSRYLAACKHVAVIARSPARYNRGFNGTPGRYLGCVTWGHLRALDWKSTPRAWRQLQWLIDEMGVAMSRVSLAQLSGVMSSWSAWHVMEEWAIAGAEAARNKFSTDNLTWVTKDTKKGKTYDRWQHYSRWLWARPWRGNGMSPTALCGFFAGRVPHALPLVDGSPDLVLVLRANPEGDVGQKLRSDPSFAAVRDAWLAGSTPQIYREAPLPDSNWEFLRVRSSALALLQASNPDTAFTEWAAARAQELVDAGVMHALGDLELAARVVGLALPTPVVGDEEEEGDDDDEIAGELRLQHVNGKSVLGEYVNLGTVGVSRVLRVETHMGPFSSTGSAAKALQWLAATQAQAIIGVGMAFGTLPDSQKHGDVLVSTSLLPYDYRIVKCGPSENPVVDYSEVRTYPARPQLRVLFEKAALAPEWHDRVHFGPLLSGASRIHCSTYREELRAAFPDRGIVVGGDMEGIGLLASSDMTESRWIIVKGISDFADEQRDRIIKETRPVACQNAAQFVLSTLLKEEELRAQS